MAQDMPLVIMPCKTRVSDSNREADLKQRVGGLSYARDGMCFQLDNGAFEATAERAVIEGAGNAASIQHPGPHPATCPLLCCQALDPSPCKGPGAQGLQYGNLQLTAFN